MASVPARRERDEVRERIAQTVRTADLPRFPAYAELRRLSDDTVIEGLRVSPEDIEMKGSEFSGVIDIYFLLQFDDKVKAFDQAMAFAGSFRGHLEPDGRVVVDDISVDVSGVFP